MESFSGLVWNGTSFSEGHVIVEGGIVTEVGDGILPGSERVGYIMPGLADAHTHIGDAGLKLDRRYGLEELVAPPNGLKHRYLHETPADRIRSDMAAYAADLVSGGVSRFFDFREGGTSGSELLRSVSPNAVILGRPVSPEFDPNELDDLLSVADGVGIPSISDVPPDYAAAVADAVHRKGKRLAIHVSERVREDIVAVMALEPDFIVHMCEATDADLRACADADVPIAVCASSNIYFGKVPPLKRMVDAGAGLAIGTDNAMLCPPDIFAEARVLDCVAAGQGCPDGTAAEILVGSNNKLLLTKSVIGVRKGPADLVMTGDSILSGPVRRLLKSGE